MAPSTTEEASAGNSSQVAFLGVDLGTHSTKVSSKTGQILRNELGGTVTTTLLGFPARSWRLIGEAAVATHAANARYGVSLVCCMCVGCFVWTCARPSRNLKSTPHNTTTQHTESSNTVLHLPRLLGRPHAQVAAEDAHLLRYHMFPLTAPADPSTEEALVALPDGAQGEERAFSPTELAAMLIGKLAQYQLVEGEDAPTRKLAFAVPKAFPPAHAKALLDAAAVAGLGPEDVMVTTATDALLAAYRQKHPAGEFAADGGERRTVLLVDVGYAQTSVVVFAMGAEGFPLVLAEAYDAALGASNVDDRLFAHFAGEIAQKYGAEEGAVAPGAFFFGWRVVSFPTAKMTATAGARSNNPLPPT